MKAVQVKFPLYVLCPDDIKPEILERLGKRNISVLTAPNLPDEVINRENREEYWKQTQFKLKIFGLEQFEKIVFLDADMIVLQNLDALFELPHMTAVAAGQSIHPDWSRLNSGLMVVVPKHCELDGLLQNVDSVYAERMAAGCGFGDQDVINSYYSDWPDRKDLHLDERYNVMLGYAGCLKRAGVISRETDIAVYHFTGAQKPWSSKPADLLAILLKLLKRGHSWLDVRMLLHYRRKLLLSRSNQGIVGGI
ncbi:MAG: hypothetical protein LUH09_08940 [Clostridiales bacterium]|nr:hypothetical protein [Clostridiales bacterium]